MSGKRILIFGGTGVLGSALAAEMKSAGMEVYAPPEAQLDITEAGKAEGFAKKIRPQAVVNCAAFTRVDDCEKEHELAYRVNAEAAGKVAAAARETGAAIFQVSTDYVFMGDKDGEYLESDAAGPLNFYGKSKLFGEELVRKESSRHCIIRTSWLFGLGGDSFVAKVIKKSKNGATQLKVVCDERGRPTYSKDLARAIRLAVEKELRGVYHFCNKGAVSWLEFAGEIFDILRVKQDLFPITAEQYALPARRPKNSALCTDKIEKALGIEIRHHRVALEEYLRELGQVK